MLYHRMGRTAAPKASATRMLDVYDLMPCILSPRLGSRKLVYAAALPTLVGVTGAWGMSTSKL